MADITQTRRVLKEYFETGDKPKQWEYEYLINSMRHVDDIIPLEKLNLIGYDEEGDNDNGLHVRLGDFFDANNGTKIILNDDTQEITVQGTIKSESDIEAIGQTIRANILRGNIIARQFTADSADGVRIRKVDGTTIADFNDDLTSVFSGRITASQGIDAPSQNITANTIMASNVGGTETTTLEQFGVRFARGSSYLQPDANLSRTLFIGGYTPGTNDWVTVNLNAANFKWNDNTVATQDWVTTNFTEITGDNVAYKNIDNNFSVAQTFQNSVALDYSGQRLVINNNSIGTATASGFSTIVNGVAAYEIDVLRNHDFKSGTATFRNTVDVIHNFDGDAQIKILNTSAGSSARSFVKVGSEQGAGYFTSYSSNYSAVPNWQNAVGIGTDSAMDGGLFLYSPDKVSVQNVAGIDVLKVENGSVFVDGNLNTSNQTITTTKDTSLSSASAFDSLGLVIEDNNSHDTIGSGGGIVFKGQRSGTSPEVYAAIDAYKESSNISDYKGALRFFTNQNTTGIPLERYRIDSSGNHDFKSGAATFGGQINATAGIDASGQTITVSNLLLNGATRTNEEVLTLKTNATGPFVATKVESFDANPQAIYMGAVGVTSLYIGSSYYQTSNMFRTDATEASSIDFDGGNLRFYTDDNLTPNSNFARSLRLEIGTDSVSTFYGNIDASGQTITANNFVAENEIDISGNYKIDGVSVVSGNTTVQLGSAGGTGNINLRTTSGNALAISGLETTFNGDVKMNQGHENKNSHWYKSNIYNAVNGILIETDADITSNRMIELIIEGNSYNNTKGPISTRVQVYNYTPTGTIINTSATSNDPDFTIDVFQYNGKVYFWFEQTNLYQTYSFKTNSALESYPVKIVNITNEVKPTTGVTNSVTITPFQTLTAANHVAGTDYVSIAGDETITGEKTFSNKIIGSDKMELGISVSATGEFSAAFGSGTTATSGSSFASGSGSDANGFASFAVNRDGVASGNAGFVAGSHNYSRGDSEFAIGQWGTDYTPTGTDTDRLFNIGNGTTLGNENDAFTVYKSGNATLNGTLSASDFQGNWNGHDLSHFATASSVFSGNYNDLTNKPDIPNAIPIYTDNYRITSTVQFDNPVQLSGGLTTNSSTINAGTGTVRAGNFTLASLNAALSASTQTGTVGEIRYTADYIYVCTATDTWKRVALSTW